tara:strand:+ start:629 stop:1213 length:585 start_codon:yes stop_codon:yes gene_type:complete
LILNKKKLNLMKFSRLQIPEIIVCEPDYIKDKRGYFVENYRLDKLNSFLGYKINFCQENETKSSFGVLRGLHFQQNPYGQAKLIRVISGAVLDIVVDVRFGSPTFGKHISIELSSKNKKQIFIPRGFAHGFVVLSHEAVFLYKVDSYYNPESERGLAFDDKELAIDWQISKEKLIISEKDMCQPLFKDAEFYKV